MPDSRRELAQLGIELDSCTTEPAFRGIRFCDDRSTVSADFPSGKESAFAVSRCTASLVDRAREVGVRMRWGTPVTLNPGQPAALAGEPVHYRYLIGADGQSSRVRSWAGLSAARCSLAASASACHYRIAPWSPYVEIHWGPLRPGLCHSRGRRRSLRRSHDAFSRDERATAEVIQASRLSGKS